MDPLDIICCIHKQTLACGLQIYRCVDDEIAGSLIRCCTTNNIVTIIFLFIPYILILSSSSFVFDFVFCLCHLLSAVSRVYLDDDDDDDDVEDETNALRSLHGWKGDGMTQRLICWECGVVLSVLLLLLTAHNFRPSIWPLFRAQVHILLDGVWDIMWVSACVPCMLDIHPYKSLFWFFACFSFESTKYSNCSFIFTSDFALYLLFIFIFL